MRDKERLKAFYKELDEIHEKHFPNWRFGQLIVNLARENPNCDFFFPEEDKMIQMFRDYADKYGRKD